MESATPFARNPLFFPGIGLKSFFPNVRGKSIPTAQAADKNALPEIVLGLFQYIST